jgi:dienelactone hydrolase
VYAGFSFGVGEAQRLAQTRSGARGALFYEGCFPITGEWAFGPWPDGVQVQIHGMDEDPFFTEEDGDLDAARALVASTDQAELFLYPGKEHLFADSSLPGYDEAAATLLLQRSLAFLEK